MATFSRRRGSLGCSLSSIFRAGTLVSFVVIVCLLATLIMAMTSWNADPLVLTSYFAALKSKDDEAIHVSSEDLMQTDYRPTECQDMVNGHCQDDGGGAWSYRKPDGTCTHTEQNAPRDWDAAKAMPKIFPQVKTVLDFGGGPGAWLLAFRDSKVSMTQLVTMEPHRLGECLFSNITQDETDLCNTPLNKLPKREYDLVQTIEVVEHIPHHLHSHVIDALTQATKEWVVWSAAHPGQPGEGHVGPSMKTKEEWINEIVQRGKLVVDESKTEELYKSAGSLIRTNAVVFRRKDA